jgi:hypothetical protein
VQPRRVEQGKIHSGGLAPQERQLGAAQDQRPFLWLVDPEARMLEAFVLGPEGYPALVPASLWP